jgi:hypothetical protein
MVQENRVWTLGAARAAPYATPEDDTHGYSHYAVGFRALGHRR